MKRDPGEYVDHLRESMDYMNLERIWDIATIHLPALKPHITRIAADLAV